MRPHRARLNDTMLSDCVFLICNTNKMDMELSTDLGGKSNESETCGLGLELDFNLRPVDLNLDLDLDLDL